jgi:hypothetical protein
MNKYISGFILVFLIAGCTPAIEYQLKKEWAAVTDYDLLETISVATGFREAFPNNKEKMIRQDRNLCLHEDAHQREITANGIDDQVGYNYCTLTPAPPATPHRWSGR